MRERHTPNIGEPVFPVIPTSISKVNPTHKGHRLINDDDLLMMCPQVHSGGDVVWVAHHLVNKISQNLEKKCNVSAIMNLQKAFTLVYLP